MKTKVVTIIVLVLTLSISLFIGGLEYIENITPEPNQSSSTDSYTYEVIINEIMASNSNTISDAQGNFPDWIEIYNPGSKPVDLTGYYLSDDISNPTKWQFPTYSFIPTNGYILIFLSGDDTTDSKGYLHTNFSLSREGETVFITQNDGETIIDLVEPIYIPRDYSYGRKPDGSMDNWMFFKENEASPGKSNNLSNEATNVLNPNLNPQFSQTGGFFAFSFNLELSAFEGAQIYYTLDGSVPSLDSFKYTKPIRIENQIIKPEHDTQKISEGVMPKFPISYIKTTPDEAAEKIQWVAPEEDIFKATVVRAISYDSQGNMSEVVTNSYFVDINMVSRYSMPIISLTADINDLFGYETGIYVPGKEYYDNGYGESYWGTPNGNYFNRGIEWEKPVHIEFFESDGNLGFALNGGIRVHGSGTRGIAQKSLRLYARKEYDIQNTFKYDIFQGLKNPITGEVQDEFRRLILRNGGQENYSSIIKDMMLQSLLENHLIDTQSARPSVVFINGEYWGIHNIRERFDLHYLSAKYGKDPEDYTIVMSTGGLGQGELGDEQHYKDMISYVRQNHMAIKKNYEHVKTLLDIENYINYVVFQISIGNFDWPSNNVNAWRYNTEYTPDAQYGLDGRWRFMPYDLDYGFGFKDSTYNSLNDIILTSDEGSEKPDWSTRLFRGLIENEEFKNKLINCFADQLNTILKPEHVIERINYFESLLAPEIPEHIDRWTIFPKTSVASWRSEVNKLRIFAQERPDNVKSHLVEIFDLGDMSTIELDVSSKSNGTIKINSLIIGENTPEKYSHFPWRGEYFNGIEIRLEAMPAPGYKFARWEGIDSNSSVIFVLPENINEISAIFERER